LLLHLIAKLQQGPKSVDLPRRAKGKGGQLTNRRVRIIRVSQQDDVLAGIRAEIMVVVKERIPLRRLVHGNIVPLGQLTNILVASDAYIFGVHRLRSMIV
jgi:hypothetical protein